MVILKYLSLLNPLKWGSKGLEILLVVGIIGLVLLVWYRGNQLDETERQLSVAQEAVKGAVEVQETQAANVALGDMLTSGLVNDWLQQEEANRQVRVDLVEAYLNATPVPAAEETTSTDSSTTTKPEPDPHATSSPTDDRDRLDALTSGLRQLACGATQHVDRPNCPAQ